MQPNNNEQYPAGGQDSSAVPSPTQPHSPPNHDLQNAQNNQPTTISSQENGGQKPITQPENHINQYWQNPKKSSSKKALIVTGILLAVIISMILITIVALSFVKKRVLNNVPTSSTNDTATSLYYNYDNQFQMNYMQDWTVVENQANELGVKTVDFKKGGFTHARISIIPETSELTENKEDFYIGASFGGLNAFSNYVGATDTDTDKPVETTVNSYPKSIPARKIKFTMKSTGGKSYVGTETLIYRETEPSLAIYTIYETTDYKANQKKYDIINDSFSYAIPDAK